MSDRVSRRARRRRDRELDRLLRRQDDRDWTARQRREAGRRYERRMRRLQGGGCAVAPLLLGLRHVTRRGEA